MNLHNPFEKIIASAKQAGVVDHITSQYGFPGVRVIICETKYSNGNTTFKQLRIGPQSSLCLTVCSIVSRTKENLS